MGHCAKRLFVGFRKYGFLAELQVRMSRDSRILLFSHHNYQVSLNTRQILQILDGLQASNGVRWNYSDQKKIAPHFF